MEELKEMLIKNFPYVDFENEKNLMTNGILDSLAVIKIITELEEMFDISITMEYIQPKYFESIEDIWSMVEELR